MGCQLAGLPAADLPLAPPRVAHEMMVFQGNGARPRSLRAPLRASGYSPRTELARRAARRCGEMRDGGRDGAVDRKRGSLWRSAAGERRKASLWSCSARVSGWSRRWPCAGAVRRRRRGCRQRGRTSKGDQSLSAVSTVTTYPFSDSRKLRNEDEADLTFNQVLLPPTSTAKKPVTNKNQKRQGGIQVAMLCETKDGTDGAHERVKYDARVVGVFLVFLEMVEGGEGDFLFFVEVVAALPSKCSATCLSMAPTDPW